MGQEQSFGAGIGRELRGLSRREVYPGRVDFPMRPAGLGEEEVRAAGEIEDRVGPIRIPRVHEAHAPATRHRPFRRTLDAKGESRHGMPRIGRGDVEGPPLDASPAAQGREVEDRDVLAVVGPADLLDSRIEPRRSKQRDPREFLVSSSGGESWINGAGRSTDADSEELASPVRVVIATG